jgi:hypothetical protein
MVIAESVDVEFKSYQRVGDMRCAGPTSCLDVRLEILQIRLPTRREASSLASSSLPAIADRARVPLVPRARPNKARRSQILAHTSHSIAPSVRIHSQTETIISSSAFSSLFSPCFFQSMPRQRFIEFFKSFSCLPLVDHGASLAFSCALELYAARRS